MGSTGSAPKLASWSQHTRLLDPPLGTSRVCRAFPPQDSRGWLDPGFKSLFWLSPRNSCCLKSPCFSSRSSCGFGSTPSQPLPIHPPTALQGSLLGPSSSFLGHFTFFTAQIRGFHISPEEKQWRGYSCHLLQEAISFWLLKSGCVWGTELPFV